ncbi:PIN domain-containing protein [Bacteriovoracaceae bacterium]|nr:PIN domain-containing protein [Bacteriovoracaceae bacterium]
MIKTFVLDTNVLLLDPMCIFNFDNNNVNIPLICLEELDRFKRDQGENGRNARHFCRILDGMRKSGSLHDGIVLEGGGTLIVTDNSHVAKLGTGLIHEKNDNIILGTALKLNENKQNAILVTKDINLRIKADALKVVAEDYGKRSNKTDTAYSGHSELEIEAKRLQEFLKGEFLPLSKTEQEDLYANQYLTLFDPADKGCILYGKYSRRRGGIIHIPKFRDGIWGIYPKILSKDSH